MGRGAPARRQHGDAGGGVIAERVRSLAMDGDEAGVRRWMAIAACYDQLTAPESLPS